MPPTTKQRDTLRLIGGRALRSREHPLIVIPSFRSPPDDVGRRYHSHEFEELTLVLGGTAKHVTRLGVAGLKRGDVFVIPRGHAHQYTDVESLERLQILYGSDELIAVAADLFQLPAFAALFLLKPTVSTAGEPHTLRLTDAQTQHASELAQRMYREQKRKTPGWRAAMHAIFVELLVFLCRSAKVKTSDAAATGIGKAVGRINRALPHSVSTEELAEIAGYSVTHFRRLFREAMGCSPKVYTNSARIDLACRLLRITSMPVTQIAFETGFNDSNYFARVFRQQTGVSPTSFRQGTNGEQP